MTRAALIAAIRAWVLLALAASLPDDFIETDGKGPRPDLPYLDVVISSSVTVGTDEEILGLDMASNPTRTVRGLRTASVAINGYGLATYDMLETLGLSLRTNASRDLNTLAGIEVQEGGAITDVSTLLDTQREKRFLVEFLVQYETSIVEVLTEVLEFVVTETLTHPGSPDLVEIITITV